MPHSYEAQEKPPFIFRDSTAGSDKICTLYYIYVTESATIYAK
jgi:hypothetical protein